MSRISIDVTPAEHQRLKAMAALQGQTIKEYVLASTLGSSGNDERQALAELETLLDARIKRADAEGWSSRSVEEVFGITLDESQRDSND